MLTIIASPVHFNKIISGEYTEIHKPIINYYTARFVTKFGVIGDESIVEELQLLRSKKTWEPSAKKIMTCTIRIGTGEGDRYGYCNLPIDQERYIIEIHSLRDVDDKSEIAPNPLTYQKAAQFLKKEALCIQRKANGCDQNCTECEYNVIQSDLINALNKGVTVLSTTKGRDFKSGEKEGYRKARKELESLEGLSAPKEVINTPGFKPFCQVCKSTKAIYTSDNQKNTFCGKCGTLLDWYAADNGYDNYERIKNYQQRAGARNYRDRRVAIEETLRENAPVISRDSNLADYPEEAIIDPENRTPERPKSTKLNKDKAKFSIDK